MEYAVNGEVGGGGLGWALGWRWGAHPFAHNAERTGYAGCCEVCEPWRTNNLAKQAWAGHPQALGCPPSCRRGL